MAVDSKGRKLPPLEKKMSVFQENTIKRRDDTSARRATKKMMQNRNPRKKGETFTAYSKRIDKLISGKKDVKKDVKKTEVKKDVKKTEVKKTTPSFGKTFADARRAGKKTFMYNGKSYTTKRADDKPKASIKSQDAKPNQSNAPKPNFKSFDKATKAEKKVLQKRFPEKKSEVKKSEVKKSKPRSTLQKLFGASEEKRKLGRNMQKRAQASMGMKKGGKVGGCKVDGIAIRGRTRARHK